MALGRYRKARSLLLLRELNYSDLIVLKMRTRCVVDGEFAQSSRSYAGQGVLRYARETLVGPASSGPLAQQGTDLHGGVIDLDLDIWISRLQLSTGGFSSLGSVRDVEENPRATWCGAS